MKLHVVYQVKDGGSTGATDPDTYLMKGIYLTRERAESMQNELVRGHDYYHPEIHPVHIPDEAVAMMFKSALEGLQNGS
jgi:hypothetical protein